jgi:cell wall-associated NlpC family hydrolase
MLRVPRGVLTRVIVVVPAVLAALFLFVATPARAASSHDDPVADAAALALVDLQASLDPQATDAPAAYSADVAALAGLVSPLTASPPEAFVAAWSAAGATRMTVVLSALAQAGVSYRHNASSPGVGFDCSGLTMYAWGQVGVELAHQDQAQIAASAPRTWDTALAGDLVDYPGHVMMYLGAGQAIVHAPHSGTVVSVREYGGRRSVRLGSPIG